MIRNWHIYSLWLLKFLRTNDCIDDFLTIAGSSWRDERTSVTSEQESLTKRFHNVSLATSNADFNYHGMGLHTIPIKFVKNMLDNIDAFMNSQNYNNSQQLNVVYKLNKI